MDRKEIFSRVDHTLLYPVSTWEQIRTLCDQAMAYQAASVCIPPCYVKRAHDYVDGKMVICTVIGFPNGNMTPEAKAFEAADALKNGAEEIDMVINIGMLKAGETDYVLDEIKLIKKTVGDKILKVIIETCDLTDDEKITMCDIVTKSGADFIKTSTGFSKSGATFHDIELFAKHVGKGVKIKAAGGIASFDDAEKFIALGADRLGTSRIIKLAMAEKVEEGTY
ncbi:MAG: deoxyribose-phosphate aldolase [Clostridia bacterium]|nr:deoxyribose-phosphate aldolase [Clostridia bacterium]